MDNHRFAVRHWTVSLALLAGLLGATESTVAEEADLPRQAISADTAVLFWLDARAVTWEKVDQSYASLMSAAPPEDKERARELIDDARKKTRAGVMAFEKGVEAGVEIFAGGGQANSSDDEGGDDAEADASDDADEDIEGDAEAAEADLSDLDQLFVRMKPGTRPKDAMAIMVDTYLAEADVAPDAEDRESLEEAKATEFINIGGGWYAATGKGMLPVPPEEQAREATPFIKALKNQKGAAIRFAWLMDDTTRFELDKARLEPGAMFFSGLLTPLRDMESTSGGMWLGENPKIVLDMQFADESDAQQFKTALDQLVGFIGLITAFGSSNADNPEEARKMQKTRAALTLLFLDREGANLSKTFDIGLLQRLAAAGLPWTKMFEQEEEEDTFGPEEAEETPSDDGEEAAGLGGSS
jgi:hypothetical protein